MHKLLIKTRNSICISGLLLCLLGCQESGEIYVLSDSKGLEETSSEESAMEADDSQQSEVVSGDSSGEAELLYVFICGQVQEPGVYTLEPGSRVCDVIELAGGCLEDADIRVVNQAELLTDGSKIYIPAMGEVITETMELTESDGLVHLNRATKEELMTLPGIGEAKADSIIEYRENQGGFSAIEELMNIPGIKEGVFRRIQDYITVE